MTKLHDFAFKALYEEVTTIDTQIEQLRLIRAEKIDNAGIWITTYNYRVRTKKF